MADLLPSLLEGDLDLMHADLDLLQCLDELDDLTSNYITTNIAPEEQSRIIIGNTHPSFDVQEEPSPAPCWHYSPSPDPPKTSALQGEPSAADETTIAKHPREPRIAIVVESKDVDDLPDGYKWRKYGKKSVKHSPYPRNYYRCSTSTCSVKKRAERSFENPSMVVLTYQGQHNHSSHSALYGAEFVCFAQTPSSLIPVSPNASTSYRGTTNLISYDASSI